MVLQCKEEVFNWFKELSGAKRIELMCGLVNLCIPLEWRFFATVIESAARRDYASLKEAELKANSPQEFEILCSLNWLGTTVEKSLSTPPATTTTTTTSTSNNLSIEEPIVTAIATTATTATTAVPGAPPVSLPVASGSSGTLIRSSSAISSPPVVAPASLNTPASPTNSIDQHLSSVRSKVIVYLCLLSSTNRVCATIVYQALRKQLSVDNLAVHLLGIPTKCSASSNVPPTGTSSNTTTAADSNVKIENTNENATSKPGHSTCVVSSLVLDSGFYSEIMLLHTLAIHHPAFTFEQQTVLAQQHHMVQQWMDAVRFAAAATAHATGVSPAAVVASNGSQRGSSTTGVGVGVGSAGGVPQYANYGVPLMTTHPYSGQANQPQQQQQQQFSHPFQSTNQQQHPQYQVHHNHHHLSHHHHQQQQQAASQHHPHQYVQYGSHPHSNQHLNASHVQYPNLSHSMSNLNIQPPSVTPTQPLIPHQHLSVNSPPGFQALQPVETVSSTVVGRRSMNKLATKEDQEGQDDGQTMKIVSFDEGSVDSSSNSSLIINGDAGDSNPKRINKESSKSTSSLVSTSSSSNSSSPLSSVTNSLSTTSGTGSGSNYGNNNLENLTKRESVRKYKEKIVNLNCEELKSMSESESVRIGAAANLWKALSNINGLRPEDKERLDAKLEKSQARRSASSQMVSQAASHTCQSERDSEGNESEHSQSSSTNTSGHYNQQQHGLNSPSYTKSSSSISSTSKWSNSVHARHSTNGNLSGASKAQLSKSPLLTGSTTSLLSTSTTTPGATVGSSAVGSLSNTVSNEPSYQGSSKRPEIGPYVAKVSSLSKVPWKKTFDVGSTSGQSPSSSSFAITGPTGTECPNCVRVCTCSNSTISSTGTTPSSTPPPNLASATPQATPTPPPSSQMVPSQQPPPQLAQVPGASSAQQLTSNPQSVIPPYWIFPLPCNGYTPGAAQTQEQLFHYYYSWALITANSFGSPSISYWPHMSAASSAPVSSVLPGSSSTPSSNSTLTSALAAASSFQPPKPTPLCCYNCGGLGHRGNECPEQTLDDSLKPSTFNMNYSGTK